MKRFGFAGLVLIVLLFAAQVASAQNGLPGCAWGYYYNPITHDYVLVCLSQPTDDAAALKPAGLAAPAPAVAPEQGSRCVSYAGPNYSVCVVASSGASAAAKPAGLAAPAPAVAPEQGLPGCPWGYYYNPMTHDYVLVCLSRSAAPEAIAPKVSGLAAPVPIQEQPFCEHFDPQLLMCLR
jgi:hypothetical protein